MANEKINLKRIKIKYKIELFNFIIKTSLYIWLAKKAFLPVKVYYINYIRN
jgi:hypothetical protein